MKFSQLRSFFASLSDISFLSSVSYHDFYSKKLFLKPAYWNSMIREFSQVSIGSKSSLALRLKEVCLWRLSKVAQTAFVRFFTDKINSEFRRFAKKLSSFIDSLSNEIESDIIGSYSDAGSDTSAQVGSTLEPQSPPAPTPTESEYAESNLSSDDVESEFDQQEESETEFDPDFDPLAEYVPPSQTEHEQDVARTLRLARWEEELYQEEFEDFISFDDFSSHVGSSSRAPRGRQYPPVSLQTVPEDHRLEYSSISDPNLLD